MYDSATIEHVRQAVENVRSFAQQDGGDIEFVSFQDGIVSVRMHGACTHCPVSSFTLKLGIEERLKELVPDVQQVIAVP